MVKWVAIAVVVLALAACTQTAGNATLQTAATQTTAAPPPQSSGTVVVYDFLVQGNRRTVSPNWAAINSQPLGTQGNPVRTLMPEGQRAYLQRLVCPDGAPPSYRRIRNVGVGVYTTIIDEYDVRCGARNSLIYMDMYHPNYIERRAVPDFRLRS